ncbi:MAG: hypothetical protein QM710_09165 [Flavobacterium sp.]
MLIGIICAVILFPPDLYRIVDPIDKEGYFWKSLDPSWVIALNYANVKNMAWGQDIAFTYGPLAYLATRVSWGVSKYSFLIFDLFYAFNICCIISFSYRKTRAKVLYLALLLGMVLFYPFYIGGSYALILFFMLIFWIRATLDKPKGWYYAMQAILLLLLFYIKFNTGLISFGLFYASVIYLYHSKKETLTKSILLLVAPVALILLMSFALNVSLWRYIQSGVNLVSGYNEIMYMEDKAFDEIMLFAKIFILVGLVGLCLQRFMERKEIIKGLLIVLLFSTGVFILYKQSFLRTDWSHATSFFSLALFLVLCIQDFNLSYWKDFKNAFLLALIGMVFYLNLYQGIIGDFLERFDKGKYIAQFTGFTADSGMNLFPNNNGLPQNILGKINTNTVDVFPWNIQLLIENKLNYLPRPVMQSYSAYTKYLEDMNFCFYNSEKAPRFVLYDYASIDNRYPFFDESKVGIVLNKNYRLVDSFMHNGRNMLLLEKIPGKKRIRMEFVTQFKGKFGTPVIMKTQQLL